MSTEIIVVRNTVTVTVSTETTVVRNKVTKTLSSETTCENTPKQMTAQPTS